MTRGYFLAALMGCMLLLVFGNVLAADASRWERPDAVVQEQTPPPTTMNPAVYTGTIRVYITEKVSGRWLDHDGRAYHHAFLAFALDQPITLGDTDTLTWHTVWDGANYQDGSGNFFSDIDPDNIEVQAAIFNSASYSGYSDPPSGHLFPVHEIDASASTTPGHTGYNLLLPGLTHSIFIEDGSATW